MNSAKEVRDDIVGAISDAIDTEGVITPVTNVKNARGNALVITYYNGKKFKVKVEEVRTK